MKKRFLFNNIVNSLNTDKITIIVGARQTGKTTILKQLENYIKEKSKSVFYFTLEDRDILNDFNISPKNLLNYLPENFKKIYILIDEIQYMKDPTNFLKYFYDVYKNKIKLIVSGSSSFYMDRKFKDSLVGRKKIFLLNTMSFSEMLYFKDFNIKDIKTTASKRLLEKLFNEYIIWGGYPEVVLSTLQEKKDILRELVYSYIKKDINEQNIKREDKFYDFLKFTSFQISSLLNKNQIANELNVSTTTIDNYLYIAQKSYHLFTISPLYKNKTKEITKMRKVYFADIGIRNFLIKDFRTINNRLKEKGYILENLFLINFLMKNNIDEIKFWRNKDGKEIDFIIDEKIAYEILYDCRKKRNKSANKKNFEKNFHNIKVKILCIDDFINI